MEAAARTGKVKKGACKGMSWNALANGERVRHSLWGHVYREKRARPGEKIGDDEPVDMRLAVFEEALRDVGGAVVVKEGITTWKQGLRRKAGWSRYELPRTLQPHERGKRFDRKAGPCAWTYRTPHELLIGRGLDLASDPFTAATANPFDREPEGTDAGEDAAIDDLFAAQ